MILQAIVRTGKLLALGAACCSLVGCWDMVEVNQLAIVNLVGMDREPGNGKYTTYYQVINPPGVAVQKGAGIKAPVYTYQVDGFSAVDLAEKTFDIVPRRPFYDHYQALIVSERFAKEGLREVINFLEKQPDRRATIHVLVTDSPLPDMMKTYIPFERLPGRAQRSMIEFQSKYSGRESRRSRVKDLVENMESSMLTVLPIVSLSGAKPMPTTERYEQIDANQGNYIMKGAAVFKHDRMIGRLESSDLSWFYLLDGGIGVFSESLIVNGERVDLQAPKPEVRRQLVMVSGKPVLKVDIYAEAQLVENDQNVKLTERNLDEIKAQFNAQTKKKASEFYEKTKRLGWDLLGIEAQIKRKSGKEWADAKKEEEAWKKTELQLAVHCSIRNIGTTIDPYKEKRG
ncbi:spore gernimation protein KC [Paenibacillus sp. A3]|uniref:Ger(x)C family spore germination protein n=1 Tax=Paenibacillus sp. A3 TaxID=1337054 RepID=UPI0006D5A4C9|nr:Ger(x)C family spore germination protein [Paenibacillus sp. A3]KPV55415.1 spore gernimation protein KC [Paenibacillus sp. A3]